MPDNYKNKFNNYKVVYVHDLLFLYDEHNTYSSTGMPESYFLRFQDAGGSEVNIVSRARILNSSGDKGYSKFESESVNICRWCSVNYKGLFSFRYIGNLLRQLRAADVLVVNIPSITGAFVLLVNVLIQKPYSIEVAADYDQFNSKKFGSFISFFMKPLMTFFIKRSIGTTYVSKYLSEKFSTNSETLIASNVNLYCFYKKPLRTISFCKKDKINLGFVGGLNARKGLLTLLQSIKYLIDRGYSNIHLDIVGGHEDRDWNGVIKSLGISAQVQLHGLCNRKYIDNILSKLDLYIQPSVTEGIPRATLEAMSFSLPVVATNLPGFKEILDEEILVYPENSVGLANMIEKVIINKDIYNEQSIKNNVTAEGFSYHILQKKRIEYYKTIFQHIEDTKN